MTSIALLHPVSVFSIQILLSSLVVGCTDASSLWRPAAVPLELACVYTIVAFSMNFMRPYWASLLGGLSFVMFLQFLDLSLLSKWDIKLDGPVASTDCKTTVAGAQKHSSKSGKATTANGHATTPVQTSTSSSITHLFWGFSRNCAFRHINTPQESKNSPPFSTTDPSYVPSRSRFVLRSFLIASCCYLTIDLLNSQPPPPDASTIFGPDRVNFFTRLNTVTPPELSLRAIVTFAGFASSYCLLSGLPLAVGAISVALSLSKPRQWRPLFGSLLEAYSVRKFWGNFWHQNLRRMMGKPVSRVVHSVLRLPKMGTVPRYLKIFGTFYISGIVHALADLASGLPWAEQLTVRFFVWQAVGIVIEDVVIGIYKAVVSGEEEAKKPVLWKRCVGYVWVIAFLLWSTPMWVYPGASKSGPETRSIVPYSFFNRRWT